MKMLLNAPAIAKLLEIDPDGTVELARKAASQVAQEVSRRTSHKAIEASVSRFLASELVEGNYFHKTIVEKYRQQLVEVITAISANFVRDVTDGAIHATISRRLDELFSARQEYLEKALVDQVDRVLRERFAVMFAAPPPAS